MAGTFGLKAATPPFNFSSPELGRGASVGYSMRQFQRCIFYGLLAVWTCGATRLSAAPDARLNGNRLTYLDEDNPFYPHLGFARLATPQWVGEPGVEAVVILAIDDMSQPAKYEKK